MSVTPNSVVTVQAPNRGHVQIVNADSTAQKTVYTAGAAGSKLTGLLASSSDTGAKIVQVSVTTAGTSFLIGSVNVPAASGTDGVTPSVNLFSPSLLPGLPLDSDGNPYLLLVSGDTLTVAVTVAVTAAKTLTVSACAAGDF